MTRRYDDGETTGRRELRLVAALVELAGERPADALRGLTRHCVDLLDAGAAALALTDAHGRPHPAAASDDRARRLAQAEHRYQEGPSFDCCRLAAPVTCSDLSPGGPGGRWPRFAAKAGEDGMRSAYAVPLRHGGRTVGALAVFRTVPGDPSAADATLALGLAEAAAIGVLRERELVDSRRLAGQLQRALDSRVVVEQAKGVLSERWQVRPDAAFTALRGYARSHRTRLADLARQVVDRTLDTDVLRGGLRGA